MLSHLSHWKQKNRPNRAQIYRVSPSPRVLIYGFTWLSYTARTKESTQPTPASRPIVPEYPNHSAISHGTLWDHECYKFTYLRNARTNFIWHVLSSRHTMRFMVYIYLRPNEYNSKMVGQTPPIYMYICFDADEYLNNVVIISVEFVFVIITLSFCIWIG